MATVEELLKENAALVNRISQLKFKLGISQVQDENERRRVKKIFDSFDRDSNGYIDRDEFEVLAYECGGDLITLTDENINAQFKQINPTGDGKITFDAFFKWLGGDKKLEQKEENIEEPLALLRFRLLSRSWYRSFQLIKDELAKSPAPASSTPASTPSASSTPSSAPENKAVAAEKKTDTQYFHFGLAVGSFKEARSSIRLSFKPDYAEAAKVRQQVEAPEEVSAFAVVDFELKHDADDMQVGEVCGMLEVVLDSIPYNDLPVKFHHSHKVDVYENEQGKKYLRVVLFTPFDMNNAFNLLGLSSNDADLPLTQADISLEFPFSLKDFSDNDNLTLTPDLLKARLDMNGQIPPGFEQKVHDLLSRVSPSVQEKLQFQLATLSFLKGLRMEVQFSDVKQFVDHIPESPSPQLVKIQQAVQGLSNLCVGKTLKSIAENIRDSPVQNQKELYNNLIQTLLGLSRIHLQFKSFIVRLDFNGLQFVPFLPSLN